VWLLFPPDYIGVVKIPNRYGKQENYTKPASLRIVAEHVISYGSRVFSASSFSDRALEALRDGVLSCVLTDAVVGAYGVRNMSILPSL
jgi:hypothetical protein